ncbi:hypothetical protein QUV83_12915 [Cellulomonas cellasea]|uniref:hypothetical protein n=1 Tax=Cellulomonas cellasea TaxID=43670 RepID=UPI0025A36650|nr:hypothetical protein [Cellulomonas cellasea]MDM8085670.1 hypothetical protein [Cellulomonas cellasea]
MSRPTDRTDRTARRGRAALVGTWALVGFGWLAVAGAAAGRLSGGEDFALPEWVGDSLPESLTGQILGAALAVMRFTVRMLA